MVDTSKEYRTDSLGLCPYLMLKGLRYLRAELSLGKHDKPIVVFVFEDKLGVGKDLELDFVRSDEKRYRDLTFFFRNEIEKKIRQLKSLDDKEARSMDNKRFNIEE